VTQPLRVSCPTCNAEVAWTATSLWRPFCSARCKGIDLGAWASDRYLIAGHRLTDGANDESLVRHEVQQ
jgi:hypothetical protein